MEEILYFLLPLKKNIKNIKIIDESDYNSIVEQVKSEEFNKDIKIDLFSSVQNIILKIKSSFGSNSLYSISDILLPSHFLN